MSELYSGNRGDKCALAGLLEDCGAVEPRRFGDTSEIRQTISDGRCSDASSVREISLIENMTCFLQANGGAKVDGKVLRSIAEALSKRLNDTSPGTLQDVTMEHSYGVGYRSPCVSLQQSQGTTSPPVQGRSVREFEEQMASLRKENFNLKLRLYFLEESVPGYQQANSEGQETIMKQLIDAKVEMEILRKEIQEKQEILKEAAQAMNQMEQIQRETEAKSQAVIDELKQKIQFLEMERDMEKSHQSGFMNDLLGRSDISENVNALQKIRELEGIVKHSEDKVVDFQHQVAKLEDIIIKRDETIKEYEEKVKELVFQNAELLEVVENKDKEVANAERNVRGLRLVNADLKEDNQHLIDALKSTQDNFRKEMSNMKVCERQMREQQEALSKMQSAITIKTANTARLLERIQDYEKMVTKVNFERNLAKRENRFFRAIIGKLQRNKNECLMIEKEEIYQQIGAEYDEKPIDASKQFEHSNYRELKARGDFHGEYTLRQKLCVNFSNSAKFATASLAENSKKGVNDEAEGGQIVEDYIRDCCNVEQELEPEFPIRYTISDASLFAGAGTSRTNSCSSLQANFSSSSIFGGSKEIPDDHFSKSQRLREELRERKIELADKMCMLEEVEEKLKSRTQLHEQACRTIRKLMQVFKSHQDEIKRLKNLNVTEVSCSKPDLKAAGNGSAPVSDLECTGLCRSLSDSEAFNEFCGAQKQKYKNTIEEQENIIRNLSTEVKKKTADLQNLINNELWEKNREIERLTKLINNKSASSALSPFGPNKEDNVELQQSFTEEDYTKALKHSKLLQRKVEVLNQRLSAEHSNQQLITQLRQDVQYARAEAESAEKWRRECADVCSVLSTRLEELAGFLNSLLKHKDVLGFLAADRRRAMHNAVNTSLDLSKSLNMTLSVSGLLMADHSLAQLCNLSCVLAEGDVVENKTFNSHDQIRVRHSIDTLRAENKALRKELDSRRSTEQKKERRSLPLLMLEHQSESEAWSEPDRKVSWARIGLEDHSVSLAKDHQQPLQAKTDSESESETRNEAKQQSRTSRARSQDRVVQLEQMIAQRDERILTVQCQLVETDNRLKKETLQVIDLTQELKELRQRNDQLFHDMLAIGDEGAEGCEYTDNAFNKSLLRQKIEETTQSLKNIEEERNRIAIEARLAEAQIGALKADMDDLKLKHDVELTLVTEEQRQKLEELRREMEALLEKRLSEKEATHQEVLKRDWVERTLYEEVKTELTVLQAQYAEAQRSIDCLTENEQELKQTLVENELTVRALKKQLDESTLQASKVIMERTKVCNEKLQLERRLQELLQQTTDQEKKCSTLLHRVAELERTQQSLNEKIARAAIKAQASGTEASQSDYTSEDLVPQTRRGAITRANTVVEERVATVGAKRHNNSSPDLGIESDAGRVSSVELSNAQRSLLKIVELPAASIDNASVKHEGFDSNGENDMTVANAMHQTIGNGGVTGVHDCAKVEHENAELRRKLIRTKRAFEDTYEKLRVANQRKARVEKEIKNQIIQTHSVLKNVRSNMED